MATRLDRLLEKIDPTNMMNDIERSVDNVITNYRGYNNTVENYEEYKQCLIDFVGRGWIQKPP